MFTDLHGGSNGALQMIIIHWSSYVWWRWGDCDEVVAKFTGKLLLLVARPVLSMTTYSHN